MAKDYILSLDQGTTSSRAMLFDKRGNVFFKAQQEIKCFFPHDGWVEQDPIDIWLSILYVINDVLAKCNLTYDDIDSIGLTNQRETTVIWDKKTGMPVYNAIVWQSRQSVKYCNDWRNYEKLVHEKTGLIINPYFSASKIRFILDNIPNGQARAENGELIFGTIDTWIMYKLSNHHIFKTDVTNASRTMLFNINTLSYDDELLNLFNIPKCMLPEVCPSSHIFGYAEALRNDLVIAGVAGDQQAALFGQNCFNEGESKNTYGTGCFMLMNVGEKPIYSKNGLITTIAWQLDNKVIYALEGSVFIGGSVMQWLRDGLQLFAHVSETEAMAKSLDDNEGVYLVPAFVGLGTPYWDNDVRGTIFGLTRGTTRQHIVRAALESIAYQSRDVIEVMKKEAHLTLTHLSVDGGATDNEFLMQYQSDLLNIDIMKPQVKETTALGAAYLAGLAIGFYESQEAIKSRHLISKTYHSQMDSQKALQYYQQWQKAIAATCLFK